MMKYLKLLKLFFEILQVKAESQVQPNTSNTQICKQNIYPCIQTNQNEIQVA